jgi:hypothetical protein
MAMMKTMSVVVPKHSPIVALKNVVIDIRQVVAYNFAPPIDPDLASKNSIPVLLDSRVETSCALMDFVTAMTNNITPASKLKS